MILYLLKYYFESKLFALMPDKWVKRKQLNRIRKFFEWAKENSAFYKKVYQDAGVLQLKINSWEDVQKIPIVDKDMILSYEKEFILTCPVSEKLAFNSSSGSTGKPMVIYFTKKEYFTSYIRTFLALKAYNPFNYFVLIGLYKEKENNEKHSFLYFFQKYLGLFRRETYSVFTPPEEIRKGLKGRNINILSSTPSSIKMLIDELKKTGEKLRVKYVVVSGETVFDDFREEVEIYLRAKLINVYGCTEHLSMAWTQPNGESFRYASNSVFAEYVNPVEIDGEMYGELVITSFVNKTMPFVRYYLGDQVKITASSKKMGKVIGRVDDILDLGDKRLYRLQFCSMYKPLVECSQFKIVKKKDNKLYFQTVCKPNNNNKEEVREKIISIWGENVPGCPLEVEFLDVLPIDPSTGKFKIIEVEN